MRLPGSTLISPLTASGLSGEARVTGSRNVASRKLYPAKSVQRSRRAFADASRPWRRVVPMFWNTPRPVIVLGTARMSSRLSVRNRPKVQLKRLLPPRSWLPRKPASKVFPTTCLSGGSETRKLSSRQGRAGSAQASSDGVGTRFDSE